GVATFTTTSLPAGTTSVTATFGGDTNFATSTSTAVTQTVRAATASTISLSSSPNPSTPGQAVTFTAVVTGPTGTTGTPTGTVTFLSGTQTLGTGTLNANGVATFTTTSLPTGTSTITAAYGGDNTFGPSTSAPLTQTVTTVGTGVTGFVTQLYLGLLGRLPDPAGLQFWVSALNSNQLTRIQVVQGFEQSTEYRIRILDQLYAKLLK